MKTRINHEATIETIDIHTSIWNLLLEIEGLEPIDDQVQDKVLDDQELRDEHNALLGSNGKLKEMEDKFISLQVDRLIRDLFN